MSNNRASAQTATNSHSVTKMMLPESLDCDSAPVQPVKVEAMHHLTVEALLS